MPARKHDLRDIDLQAGIRELKRLRIKHGLLNIDQVQACLPKRTRTGRPFSRSWIRNRFPVAPVILGGELFWRAAAIQRFLANLPSKW